MDSDFLFLCLVSDNKKKKCHLIKLRNKFLKIIEKQ